jgi:hypothetical protein
VITRELLKSRPALRPGEVLEFVPGLIDIQYYYESQLPGEAAAVADRHVHPAEPRTARLTLALRF